MERVISDVLIGGDDRTPVKYAAICKLRWKRRDDGKLDEGTGFLVDSKTVITAGHNVSNVSENIDVLFPGTGITISARKFNHYGPEEGPKDMGVILLSKPRELTEYIRPEYSTPKNGPVTVCGYPYQKPELLGASGSGNLRDDGCYYYRIDTTGGQSGGPVLLRGTLTAIGVHIGYADNQTINRAAVLSFASGSNDSFENFLRTVQ